MNKTILVVDDDADDRELLWEIAKQMNPAVNIEFAANGLQAIEYLNDGKEKEQLPCLIILDLNMPFLDGKETYKRIKQDEKLETVPVIIYTSSHNPSDKLLFSTLGVEFISKPDDFSFMNKIVGHMLGVCSNGTNRDQ